jgi:hypothetical protein
MRVQGHYSVKMTMTFLIYIQCITMNTIVRSLLWMPLEIIIFQCYINMSGANQSQLILTLFVLDLTNVTIDYNDP